ncbi:MAG: hypothetical protein RL030_1791 [Pseudomonadota bacterium]|jgi:hypothetical protein
MIADIFSAHVPVITDYPGVPAPPAAPPAPTPSPAPPAAQPITFSAVTVAALNGLVGTAIGATTLATITCADAAMTVSISDPVAGLTFSYVANVLSVSGTPTAPGRVHRVVVSYIASDGSVSARGSTAHTIGIMNPAVSLVVGTCNGLSAQIGQYVDVVLCSPTLAADANVLASFDNYVQVEPNGYQGYTSTVGLIWAWTQGATSSGTLRVKGVLAGATGTIALLVTYRDAITGVTLGTSGHTLNIVAAYVTPPAAPAPAPAPPAPPPSAPPAPSPAPAPGLGPDPLIASVKALLRFDAATGLGYNQRTGTSLTNVGVTSTTGAVNEAGLFGGMGSYLQGVVDGCDGADGNLNVDAVVDLDAAVWASFMAAGDDVRYCPVVTYLAAAGDLVWTLGFYGIREGYVSRRRVVYGVLYNALTGFQTGWFAGNSTINTASWPEMTSRPGRFVQLTACRRRNPTSSTDGLYDQGTWFDGLANGTRRVPSLSLLRSAVGGTLRIGGTCPPVEYLDYPRSTTLIGFSGAVDEVRVGNAPRHGDLLLPGVNGLGIQISAIPSTRRVMPWPNY